MANPTFSFVEREHVEQLLLPILTNLRSKDTNIRKNAALELRQLVEIESRELSTETFTKFMNDLTPRLFELVQSQDTCDKLGGIEAIDELIDVSSDDDEITIIRFANYLRNFFVQPATARSAMVRASKALGHLARAGGTLTTDFVDFEVKRALEWLQGERHEYHVQRRLAACLVCIACYCEMHHHD